MAYVLNPDFVEDCVGELLAQRIHPHFAGYLCLKRTAARDGRADGLHPDFRGFFRTFFAVPNAPSDHPYFRPFWDERSSSRKAWYQRNIAGSYSPGSARRIQPFMAVVDVSGSGRSAAYSLRRRHWQLARRHLAYGEPIDAVALAGFLYRDYGFVAERPDGTQLVDIFRTEFGYPTTVDGDDEFNHLYREESRVGDTSSWFELFLEDGARGS